MTKLYNHKLMTKRRQTLRRSRPKAEAILWSYIKGRQLSGYKFRRQYSVGRHVIDFYCPNLKLGLEVDGPSHFLTEEIKRYDQQRQHYIESLGIKIIRVTNRDVYHNMSGVIEYLLNTIKTINRL